MVNAKVYCIIVTYNAMKWVDKCLGSLRTSSVEIHPVVIDNCSSDETVSYITLNFPEVHIIVNNENRGFGQANNQGIEHAYEKEGTHFFLLNQDAWVHRDTIGKLVEVQDKYKIAIASPIHLNGSGNLLDYNFFTYSVMIDSNVEFVSDLILNDVKPYYIVSKINAAAWMLSKRTVEEIGGFDPVFFHYGEDGNYCQRVKFHRGSIAFVADSYINHDRERKGNVNAFKRYSTVSKLLNQYSDINESIWSFNKARLIMHLQNSKLALSFLLGFKFKEFRYLVYNYFVFIRKLPQIRANMKLNKKTGPTWLNLRKSSITRVDY